MKDDEIMPIGTIVIQNKSGITWILEENSSMGYKFICISNPNSVYRVGDISSGRSTYCVKDLTQNFYMILPSKLTKLLYNL